MHLFTSETATNNFIYRLDLLVSVLSPIAKSCTCLESTHSTVSDVYVFYLAIMAELWIYITDANGVDTQVKEHIRITANKRFKQMFDKNDVYLTGFVLDPRWRGADFAKDLNPLVLQKIKIPAQAGPSVPNEDALPKLVATAGAFLMEMARKEYVERKTKIAGLDGHEVVDRLKGQIVRFIKGQYPFNMPVKPTDGPYQWWERVSQTVPDNEAQPLAQLAINIFAIKPNSMDDERTASTFTWLNGPLRNQLRVATLTRLTRLRQWFRYQPSVSLSYRHVSPLYFSTLSRLPHLSSAPQ